MEVKSVSETGDTKDNTINQSKSGPYNVRHRSFQVAACILPLALRFTRLESTKIAAISVIISILVLFEIFWDKKSSDPYGLFHLAMNVRPGDSPEQVPKTEWLNMGCWKVTQYIWSINTVH
jgi:hypothetical protein